MGGTEGEAGGNNTGNNWTDNQIGTADDRFIIWRKSGNVQATWVTLQAMVAQAFQATDSSYAQRCLEAGLRCRHAANPRREQRGAGLGDTGRPGTVARHAAGSVGG